MTGLELDAGLWVSVQSADPAVERALSATLGASGRAPARTSPDQSRADLVIEVEDERRPFDLTGLTTVTRGVWAGPGGDTVIDSVGGSGFAQHWSVTDGRLRVRSRWLPSTLEAAASSALRARFRALRAQVLLHYPVLWWAASRGMAPLHVSAVEIDGVTVLLAGPGGVGKSSLVARELDTGGAATCDNLATCDGRVVRGLREQLRLPAASPLVTTAGRGRRASHGRRERSWHDWVPELRPDLVVVVRRGSGPAARVRPIDPAAAQRAIVAGTFCAGELRRFWQLSATLALTMPQQPVLPPVEAVARALTSRLPCFELELASQPGPPLRVLLGRQLAGTHEDVLR